MNYNVMMSIADFRYAYTISFMIRHRIPVTNKEFDKCCKLLENVDLTWSEMETIAKFYDILIV